jgi:hypothetical protein
MIAQPLKRLAKKIAREILPLLMLLTLLLLTARMLAKLSLKAARIHARTAPPPYLLPKIHFQWFTPSPRQRRERVGVYCRFHYNRII